MKQKGIVRTCNITDWNWHLNNSICCKWQFFSNVRRFWYTCSPLPMCNQQGHSRNVIRDGFCVYIGTCFKLHGCCGEWEGRAREPVNTTSLVAVVTPTDRPKSVRNHCVIGLFYVVVCVVTLPFWHFCWCRGFCHWTESDLFLFFQLYVLLFVRYLQEVWILSLISICYLDAIPVPSYCKSGLLMPLDLKLHTDCA